jgi:hypothetical protein
MELRVGHSFVKKTRADENSEYFDEYIKKCHEHVSNKLHLSFDKHWCQIL